MPVDGVSMADIESAYARIAGLVVKTPLVSFSARVAAPQGRVYLKCENKQRVGAFKYRGATNAVRLLTDDEAARGVLTHSSGNHAQALALAARERGIRAWIVMPENAPAVKRDGVLRYGGEIISCEATVLAREGTARALLRKTGAVFIHPYDNDHVIAGQGTTGLELWRQAEEQDVALDAVLVPVGGGGLASGVSTALRSLAPNVDVWGIEPEGADDAARSLALGRIVPVTELPGGAADTICDGLRTSLCPRTFRILRNHLSGILTVSDDGIKQAMSLLRDANDLIVEPSGAVGVSALLQHASRFQSKCVAVVLSGGNCSSEPASP